jgi:hypothetical protein
MKNQTFVFAHDQKIITDFIEKNKFNNLDNMKYVFLGSGKIDKIENLDNVIIARNHENNIEKWNKTLIAYTGWYFLWKNKLISADYVNLFEYDIIVKDDIQNVIKSCIDNYQGIDSISYNLLNVHDYWFLGADLTAKSLLDSIKKNYDIDAREYIKGCSSDSMVGVTSNQTLKRETFESFMEWMEPVIDDIKEDRMAGHYPERALPFYLLLNNKSGIIIKDVLAHFRLDSHNTQSIPEDYKKQTYEKILNHNG